MTDLATNSTKVLNAVKEKKKICCVCKETKRVRDECVVLNGENKCRDFIEAHNACLRSEGFDVRPIDTLN